MSSPANNNDDDGDDGTVPSPNTPYFIGLAGQLGVGGILGYSTGYAAKEIGKRVMYYAGAGVITLQLLVYKGIVEVHWDKVFSLANASVDTDGDGKFTAADASVWFHRFTRMISAGVPGSATFLAGVYMGLRA